MILTPVLTVIVFIVGILIGCVGIGGVLLVPTLKYLGNISLHQAIPACMVSFIVAGLVGAAIYARHGTIDRAMAIKICTGALPGAFIGAYLLPYISPVALEIGIGILVLVCGIHALRKGENKNGNIDGSNSIELGVIGLVTGIGSALSGTGGPLLLVPILIWRKVPVLTAIGLSQVIQIPISLMATLGNVVYGEVDFRMGLTLGLVLGGGTLLGAKISHKLPFILLKKLVAGLLIIVGLAILYRLVTA